VLGACCRAHPRPASTAASDVTRELLAAEEEVNVRVRVMVSRSRRMRENVDDAAVVVNATAITATPAAIACRALGLAACTIAAHTAENEGWSLLHSVPGTSPVPTSSPLPAGSSRGSGSGSGSGSDSGSSHNSTHTTTTTAAAAAAAAVEAKLAEADAAWREAVALLRLLAHSAAEVEAEAR
jgi:hypothetical protein